MADTIDSTLEQAAIDGVSRVSVDGTTVDSMPIADRIAAAEYLAKKASTSKNHLGLRLRKIEFGDCG